jgi:iron complex transport system substrate-binding protein
VNLSGVEKTAWPLLALLLTGTAPDAGTGGALWLGPKPTRLPSRVVTLAPSLTETVLALGKGALLVGVSRFDEAPEVSKLKRVGGFNDPSIESVVALKAELVLVQKAPANQKPVEKMAELGIPVLALPLTTLEDALEATLKVGAALGASDAATALVTQVRNTQAEVRARAMSRKRLRVLLVYGWQPLVVAGPGSFAHELLLDAGAVNVAQASPTPYPVFSAESAVALKPDVVLDAADVPDGKETYQSLPGLKQARWVTLRSKDLLHPGPSLGRGLLELEQLLYPSP